MHARANQWIAPFALLIGAVACVVPDKVTSYQPAWEPFDPAEEGWITTRPVQLVADCQIHNLYSQAVPERNLSAEAAVSTAIRPPQLDLFSRDVLSWIVENGSPETEAILFMGAIETVHVVHGDVVKLQTDKLGINHYRVAKDVLHVHAVDQHVAAARGRYAEAKRLSTGVDNS